MRKTKADVGTGTELVGLGSSEMIGRNRGSFRASLRSKRVEAAVGWPETVRASHPVVTQKSACVALVEIRRHSDVLKINDPESPVDYLLIYASLILVVSI